MNPPMDKVLRLVFLDSLVASGIGRIERRKVGENVSHRWGYGPTLVWDSEGGPGTLVVLPYSSGSGVVRIHLNRYSHGPRPRWSGEITVMPDELAGLAPWTVQYIRACSAGESPPENGLFVTNEPPRYLWSRRAQAHEAQHAVNVRGSGPVKEGPT